MKFLILVLITISLNVHSMEYYEEGFIDGYYLTNTFSDKINPCSLMKDIICSSNDTPQDCMVKQSSRVTSCNIHYIGRKLN